MDKVLLDTNILLDVMIPDRSESEYAAKVVCKAGEGSLDVIVSAGSLKDVYYIARKALDDSTTRSFIRGFIGLFKVVPIDEAVCLSALDSSEPDFEDGIVRVIAESEKVDFILTRDFDAYRDSRVKALTAKRYLELCMEM